MRGTIKWYDSKKLYGFIQYEKGKDQYFHKSSLKTPFEPSVGDEVDFKANQGKRKNKATDIVLKKKATVIENPQKTGNSVSKTNTSFKKDNKSLPDKVMDFLFRCWPFALGFILGAFIL